MEGQIEREWKVSINEVSKEDGDGLRVGQEVVDDFVVVVVVLKYFESIQGVQQQPRFDW